MTHATLHQEASDGGQPLDEQIPITEPRQRFLADFREMIAELAQCHELLRQMVLRDLRVRYKQAVMGFAWAVLMPVLIVGSGFLIRFAMAQMAGEPLAGGAFAGMTVKALGWAFFVGSIRFSVGSLVGNSNLVTKIYFPREVFPVSAVLTQMIDSLVGSSVILVLLFGFLGVGFSLQILWALPLIALLVLLTVGVSMFVSCTNVFFRDIGYIVQTVMMFGIFFSPVFYEPQFLGPAGCVAMMFNPVAPLLEGLRLAVIEHHNLLASLIVTIDGRDILVWTPLYLAYSAVWSVLGFLGAWWLFHKLEFVYAEYV